jgi:hypothetical protein
MLLHRPTLMRLSFAYDCDYLKVSLDMGKNWRDPFTYRERSRIRKIAVQVSRHLQRLGLDTWKDEAFQRLMTPEERAIEELLR